MTAEQAGRRSREGGLLALAGTADRTSLAWFRVFLLLNVGVRAMFMYTFEAAEGERFAALVLQALALAGLAGVVPNLRMLATRVAAVLLLVHVVLEMPLTANHAFLELVCLGLLAGLDESREDEAVLLGRALRWVTAIVLFYTGIQKLLYGYWFDGTFLGYSTAAGEDFATLFRHVLPAEEFQRLQAEAVLREGAGPFSVDWWPFVVMSNAVYVMEMVLPVLLLLRRTRAVAAAAAIALVIGIELGAREIFFGLLTVNLLLLFLPGPWCRRLFPLFAATLAYLAGVAFGLLPMFTFKV